MLFAAVNVARKLKVDPELALRAAADRFRGRVEARRGPRAHATGADWDDLGPDAAARLLRPGATSRGSNETR